MLATHTQPWPEIYLQWRFGVLLGGSHPLWGLLVVPGWGSSQLSPEGLGPASMVLLSRLEVAWREQGLIDRARSQVTGSFYTTWREGGHGALPPGGLPWLLTWPSPTYPGTLSWVPGGPASRCAPGGGSRLVMKIGYSRLEWRFWGPNLPLRRSVPLQCLQRMLESSETASQGPLLGAPEVRCWEYFLQGAPGRKPRAHEDRPEVCEAPAAKGPWTEDGTHSSSVGEATIDLNICRDTSCVRDPGIEGKACGMSFLPGTVLGCHVQVVGGGNKALSIATTVDWEAQEERLQSAEGSAQLASQCEGC